MNADSFDISFKGFNHRLCFENTVDPIGSADGSKPDAICMFRVRVISSTLAKYLKLPSLFIK